MANEEQLAILRQGVDVWNGWRAEHRHITPDFVGAQLQGAQLIGVDLQETQLIGANLSRAVLYTADLTEADLTRADLIEAQFFGVNLGGAQLQEAQLIGASLQGAQLIGAQLIGAVFYEANLSRAILYEAQLQKAQLQGAVFYEANLQEAQLQGANLQDVQFQGASLFGANLGGTFLSGANMRKARIGRTLFADVDLREVQNLEHVEHSGPSTIGTDTLYNSRSDIPEVFLRGCGVPNSMIEYVHSLLLAEHPIDYYSCFISYSHVDKSFARRLHDALQGRGIRCWLDEHQLLPGHDIYNEIERGIRLWDKILLCASVHSLTSWWVGNEIDNAFAKEQQFTRQHGSEVRALIPLNLDNTLLEWQDGRANKVRSRLAADFTSWEHDNTKFEHQFERLVKALQTNEGREDPPKPKLGK